MPNNFSHNLTLIQENEYETMLPLLRKELEKAETVGSFLTRDGLSLCYACYTVPNPTAAVVIVHGFTEFYRKYDEMIGYYLKAGYSVFIYDQRGHGLSDRQVDNLELTHVDRFEDYVDDLEQFIDTIVKPSLPAELPLYLFSHSMGGAIAVLYLARHPQTIQRAVLSAPMICPKTHGIPRVLMKRIVKGYIAEEGEKAAFRHAGRFNPDPSFSHSSDTGYARFRRHVALRVSNPRYRNSAGTNGWIYESVVLQETLLRPKIIGAITLPVLMLCAENDRVVKRRLQKQLAARLPNCRRVVLGGAKHGLFTANDETLAEYYGEIFRFLEAE